MENSNSFEAIEAMIQQGWLLKQYSDFEKLLELLEKKNLITETERQALIELAKKMSMDKLDDKYNTPE